MVAVEQTYNDMDAFTGIVDGFGNGYADDGDGISTFMEMNLFEDYAEE
jgi:hypothetical protein